jgi:histidine triad (HIT) family protein
VATPDPDCLFCKVVLGEVSVTMVREDEDTVTFVDIDPQAPVHLLVIPKKHVRDLVAVGAEPEVAAALTRAIRETVDQERIGEFRTVFNTGAGAGQVVFHVHAHILAGRPFGWPPG